VASAPGIGAPRCEASDGVVDAARSGLVASGAGPDAQPATIIASAMQTGGATLARIRLNARARR